MSREKVKRRYIFSTALSALAALGLFVNQTLPPVAGNPAGLAPAAAPCVIQSKAAQPAASNNDPLAKFLRASAACPLDVFKFRSQLAEAGAQLKPSLVANRGFHNRKQSADGMHFMMFETVSGRLGSLGLEINDGEFFFGHFTATNGTTLSADQQPFRDALMIELIAWDPAKEAFNFYELKGNGIRGQWFYRGDSLDIQQDVEFLHRQPTPGSPKFGARLRCSGCHIAGGPIMKELAAPHNDWDARSRPLPFGSLKPDERLRAILDARVAAEELALSVKAGQAKLENSAKFRQAKQALSLPEQLRPLFCPVELNLESDPTPLDDRAAQLNIPAAFFVNPALAQGSVAIKREHYEAALTALNASFPEAVPARRDADHGWLTPVKAFSDALAVEALIRDGLIDREFAADVLAVDLSNPLFSPGRCGLLRLLPPKAETDWQAKFKAALKAAAPGNPAARELSDNLTNPLRDAKFQQARAARLLEQCRKEFQTVPAVTELVRLLAQRRAEVGDSEISKNPLGHILEDEPTVQQSFRVIFPVVRPPIASGSFRLTEDGKVIRR